MRCLLVPIVLALLSGCGGRASPAGNWSTYHYADNPLVGRVWSADRDTFLGPDDLVEALAEADVVVLGEKHDNPDHHHLQAWIIQRLARVGAVAFEMLDEEDAPALAQGPTTTQAVAAAVAWEDSGWPHFLLYEPVFAAALERAAPLFAAHPSAGRLRTVMRQGLRLDPLLKLDPLAPDQQKALEDEIRETHCGYAPEKMVAPMADAQRFKDAWMAARVIEAEGPRVLIAGAGHARRDVGVPLYLRRQGARKVISVGFVEVRAGAEKPSDYAVERFDYVYFTPRLEDVDPCEKFRAQLEQMGAMRAPASGGEAAPAAAQPSATPRRCTVYRAGPAEGSDDGAAPVEGAVAIQMNTAPVEAAVPDEGVEAACAARAAEACGAAAGPDACRFEVHAGEPSGWDGAKPLPAE